MPWSNVAASAPLHPGYVSGRSYRSPTGNYGTTDTLTLDLIYYVPMMIYRSASFSDIGYNVSTAVVGNAKCGLYNSLSGLPSSRVVACTAVTTNTTGAQFGAFSAATIVDPGAYWLAVLFEAAAKVHTIGNADHFSAEFIGYTAATLANNNPQGRTESMAYGTGLPATATPSGIGTNAPALVMRAT